MGLQAGLLASIFWASKLAKKGGETSETRGEHVALAIWMQGLVPTQRVPTLRSGGVRDKTLLDLTGTKEEGGEGEERR